MRSLILIIIFIIISISSCVTKRPSAKNAKSKDVARSVSPSLYLKKQFNFAKNQHQIAITFDDLTMSSSGTAKLQMEINKKILKSLAAFQAPAIGFVNEYRLIRNDRKKLIDILQMWVDKGYDLGNHTFSHTQLSATTISDFENEIVKDEEVSKKIMLNAGRDYKYFRYPYLDEGSNERTVSSISNFLSDRGYTVAPVTFDTNDWVFNKQLLRNYRNKKEIIKSYLAYTRSRFLYYDKMAREQNYKKIKHIWLLHLNVINAYAINDLLKMANEFNYKFVSLDEILKTRSKNKKRRETEKANYPLANQEQKYNAIQ